MKKIEKLDYISIKETIDTMESDRKELCIGLLDEIKFMNITLMELKKKINDNGVITPMCQGSYSIDRANPALSQYNSLIKNYSNCIKQLNDLLPKEMPDDGVFDPDGL